MNLILLSGGSGQRLWPLSNNIRSKQFVPLLKNAGGEYERAWSSGSTARF